MKNIIKTVWSCWDKTDRFVAIFSIIAIIAVMCFFCTSCNAQPSNIPEMDYYDVDTNFDKYLADNNGILFYADGIINFVYEVNDDIYIIEYDDADSFDPDNMMYNKEYGYHYIELECDSTTFFDCLIWYTSLDKDTYNEEFYGASKKYFIVEDKFENDEPYYKLMSHEHN